jgi:hypothetical protein
VVAGDISPIPVSARLLRDGRLQLQEQHAHDVQEEDEINLETKNENRLKEEKYNFFCPVIDAVRF